MWTQVIVVGLVGLVAAHPKRLVLAFGVGVKSVTRIILALRGHTPTSYAETRVVFGQVNKWLLISSSSLVSAVRYLLCKL